MQLDIRVRKRSWLDEVLFDGIASDVLDLPGGARLRRVRVQPVRSTPEGAIAQFMIENVVTALAVSIVANFLYEKLSQRRRDVAGAKVDGVDIGDANPEEIRATIRVQVDVSITSE